MLKQLHTLATSSTLEKEIGEKKEKPDNNVFHSFDLTLALSGPWNIPTSSLLHRKAIGRTILKTTKNDNNIWLIDYNANKFLTPQLLLLSIETKKKKCGVCAHTAADNEISQSDDSSTLFRKSTDTSKRCRHQYLDFWKICHMFRPSSATRLIQPKPVSITNKLTRQVRYNG